MGNKRLLLIIAMMGFVISACSLDFNTNIKPDGSGEFSMQFVVNDIDIAFIEAEEGESIDEIMIREFDTTNKETACNSLAEEGDFPLQVSVKYQEKNRNYICEISMPFSNLDELVEIYDDMFYGMTGTVRMVSSGELTYAVNVETDDFETAEDLGIPAVEYTWSVTAPGSIEQHNADSKRGNKLSWELQPESYRSVEIISTAGTDFGTPFDGFDGFDAFDGFEGFDGFPVLLIVAALACMCFAGLIILGGIVFFVLRKR